MMHYWKLDTIFVKYSQYPRPPTTTNNYPHPPPTSPLRFFVSSKVDLGCMQYHVLSSADSRFWLVNNREI